MKQFSRLLAGLAALLFLALPASASNINCQVYSVQPAATFFPVGSQPVVPCDRSGTLWANIVSSGGALTVAQGTGGVSPWLVKIDQTTPGTTNGVVVNSSALPALAATSTKQSDGSQKTQIVDGSGNVIASTSNNLNVQCANCSGAGVSAADEASFTAGTSLFAPFGGFFQTTATNNPLTNGQQGFAQMTAQRAVFVNLRNASGTEIAPLTDTQLRATPVPVSGTLAISGTVGVTQSTSPWIVAGGGTAGTAATGVSTVQGIASMTPLLVTASAGTNLNTSLLALESGGNLAATATSTALLDNVVAPVTPAAATATGSTLLGCEYRSTLPTWTNAQQGAAQCGTRGSQDITIFGQDTTTAVAVGTAADDATLTGTLKSYAIGALYDGSTVDLSREWAHAVNSAGAGIQENAILGECDDTSPTAITENQVGTARINCTTRELLVAPTPYPSGATPETASSAVVNNAVATATLAASAGKTTYITGFTCTPGAATTGVSGITLTVTGTITGTLNYIAPVYGTGFTVWSPLTINYPYPVPASATNTTIAVSMPAVGTGATGAACNATGFQL